MNFFLKLLRAKTINAILVDARVRLNIERAQIGERVKVLTAERREAAAGVALAEVELRKAREIYREADRRRDGAISHMKNSDAVFAFLKSLKAQA